MSETSIKYISTKNATILAIIKIVEALAACAILGMLLFYRQHFQTLVEQNSFIYQLFREEKAYHICLYIVIGHLILTLLDGVFSLLTRVVKKGAGIVALCHLIRFIFLSALVILYSIVVFQSPNEMRSLFVFIFTYFGVNTLVTGSWLQFLIFIERVIGFLIMAIYHYKAFSITYHISKELKAGKLINCDDKPQSLKAQISVMLCCIFVGIIADLIQGYIMGDITVSMAIYINPIWIACGDLQIISIAVIVLYILKLIVLHNCSTHFQTIHAKIKPIVEDQ